MCTVYVCVAWDTVCLFVLKGAVGQSENVIQRVDEYVHTSLNMYIYYIYICLLPLIYHKRMDDRF